MNTFPKALAFSNGKYFLKRLNVRHKFGICFLNVSALLKVTPSNSTSSDSLMVIGPVLREYL